MGATTERDLACSVDFTGLNPKISKGSAFDLCSYRNKTSCKSYKASSFTSRGKFVVRETGPRVSERSLTGLLFAPLHGAQEVRGLSPSNRPQVSELHDSLSAFSHGNGQGHSVPASTKRMDNEHRSLRRIFAYPNSSGVQKILKTAYSGAVLPIQGNVLRLEHSPSYIHEAARPSCCTSSFQGHNVTSLPGRLAHQGPFAHHSLQPYPSGALSVSQTGPTCQFQEVRSCSQDSVCVSGYGYRPAAGLDKTYPRAGYENLRASQAPCCLQQGPSSGPPLSSGQFESCFPVYSTGQVTCAPSSILCEGMGPQPQGGNRLLYSPREVISHSSGLVEEPRAITAWSPTPSSRTSGHLDHRCQSPRLGGLPGHPQSLREVDQGRVKFTYNNLRASSCTSGIRSTEGSGLWQEPSSLMRQHSSSSLSTERGRNTFSLTVPGVQMHTSVVSSTQCHTAPILSTGPSELFGRFTVPLIPSSGNGVDTPCSSVSANPQVIPRTRCGLVLHESEQSATSIHQPLPRSSSLEGRCFYSGVGAHDSICFPTLQVDTRGSEEVEIITHPDDPDSSGMAQPELVPRSPGPPLRPATTASNLAQVTPTTTGSSVSPEPPAPPSSRLATVRSRIRQAGFSGSVARYAAASQRPSSLRLYQSHWRVFSAWCEERDIDPSQASVHQIADFLVYLFEVKKYAPSTIANYRSSIASALGEFEGVPLSLHPCLSKLIKAFASSRPIERPRVPEWDLSRVLRTLRSEEFEPPRWQTRQDRLRCTWKTIFLLALASASRRSELQAISRDPRDLIFSDRGMSMRVVPGFLAKTAVPGMDPAPFFIPALEPFSGRDSRDRLLCPVRMVKKYLSLTGGTRPKDRLFRKVRGEGPPSSQTIASWIKACVRHAHQHRQIHVTAHQVRRMSASWAFHGGVHSVDEILQAGTWASHSTFTSFYLADVRLQPDGNHRMHPVVARKQLARF